MKTKKTYLVFVIQAHEGMTPQMTVTDVCQLELIAKSLEEAITKAKKLMPNKKFYRCSMIIEKYLE